MSSDIQNEFYDETRYTRKKTVAGETKFVPELTKKLLFILINYARKTCT
jgi:hypothetical protein